MRGMSNTAPGARAGHVVPTRDGPLEFTGELLGFGTSRRTGHGHDPRRIAERHERCSACRWNEVRIWWSTTHDSYVISHLGLSELPEEEPRIRALWTNDAAELVTELVVTPSGGMLRDYPGVTAVLPPAARAALDEAARNDPEINAGYLDWLQDQTVRIRDLQRAQAFKYTYGPGPEDRKAAHRITPQQPTGTDSF